MSESDEPIVLVNNAQYKSNPYTIVGGKANGRLLGGNLSVFNALIGSKYLPLSAFDDAILFLEDVHEDPEHIDRMLTTLRLAGFMHRLAGVVFGICKDCE
jgi:muramoyltetrapeptide carboxypeptidase